MSECKHEWRIYKESGTVCIKCKMNAINLIANLERELAAKDRQLDAAARDITEHGVFACNMMDNDCPKEDGCLLMKNDEPYDICREMWRKRWEEMANHG